MWHKITNKLPDKNTRYAGRHGVTVLGFDENEYNDSGSCDPKEVSFMFKEKIFLVCAYGKDNISWVRDTITHWKELPKIPIIKKKRR